jgi:transcription elongation factor
MNDFRYRNPSPCGPSCLNPGEPVDLTVVDRFKYNAKILPRDRNRNVSLNCDEEAGRLFPSSILRRAPTETDTAQVLINGSNKVTITTVTMIIGSEKSFSSFSFEAREKQ